MKTLKILFADDDLKYSLLLKEYLMEKGYDVTYVGNGLKAIESFSVIKPDLVLLDINMPEMNGFEVAEKIRKTDANVMIFFLTDRTEKSDRLKGFSLQGNDYLSKPFYPEELLARIEERFRKNIEESVDEEVYEFGNTRFLYSVNEICTSQSRVVITSRQAEILRILAKNTGKTVSKEIIEKIVWGMSSFANSLSLNVQISYLRKALSHDSTICIVSFKKKGFALMCMNSSDKNH